MGQVRCWKRIRYNLSYREKSHGTNMEMLNCFNLGCCQRELFISRMVCFLYMFVTSNQVDGPSCTYGIQLGVTTNHIISNFLLDYSLLLSKVCTARKYYLLCSVPGLNKVAKKLKIDCSPAMVGWDNSTRRWSIPQYVFWSKVGLLE